MPRRRHKTQTEGIEIVEDAVERVDFEFAAVAGTGVDFADGERPPEALAREAPSAFWAVLSPALASSRQSRNAVA